MPGKIVKKPRPSSYKTLTIARKLEIVKEANVPGVSDASIGRKHDVSPTSIRSWRKNEEKLMKEMLKHLNQKKRISNTSSSCMYPDMEMILYSRSLLSGSLDS